MSRYLWKAYLEEDVSSFQQLLDAASNNARPGAQRYVNSPGNYARTTPGSPGAFSTSPTIISKPRKPKGLPFIAPTRADFNSKDSTGQTILHRACSSNSDVAFAFAVALLDHPFTDIYIQDLENGWTALHRAFYFGNITLARLILERETRDILERGKTGGSQTAGGLMKTKDREGNGPFDLLAMTVKSDRGNWQEGLTDLRLNGEEESGFRISIFPAYPRRSLLSGYGSSSRSWIPEVGNSRHDDVEEQDWEGRGRLIVAPAINLNADEVFTFGSNSNAVLGFGDEDNRQFPERVTIRRPDHLLQRFHTEYLQQERDLWDSLNSPHSHDIQQVLSEPRDVSSLPIVIRNKRLIIQDVQMSKLHTAVLTTDPEANLYMCGHGPGGRLGTGDSITRYSLTCIEGGGLSQKKIVCVALGQNHTLAVSSGGEIFSWGSNGYGQLGYSLPQTVLKDEDPVQLLPRQIFGPLKREVIRGAAASRIHSVAHTDQEIWTFGKNEGQLGIMGSDARSLETQVVPRKIGTSMFPQEFTIRSVAAIDKATICLLRFGPSSEVWVFANYGFTRLAFSPEIFDPTISTSFFRSSYDRSGIPISKITAAGDTICAMSPGGEVFTVVVGKVHGSTQAANSSTTNPVRIRDALSAPKHIWSARKMHMSAVDVDVDQDGSIILTTKEGSVWKRAQRANAKKEQNREKDYKFSRVPGLTNVKAVRASSHGAYAAIRVDCHVTRTSIHADGESVLDSISTFLPFRELYSRLRHSTDDSPSIPLPESLKGEFLFKAIKLTRYVMATKDIEGETARAISQGLRIHDETYNVDICTTSGNVIIPMHQFIIAGRSRILRETLASIKIGDEQWITDVVSIERSDNGRTKILFHGIDFLTILNLVYYLYTEDIICVWQNTQSVPSQAARFRQVRTELMKIAALLELRQLEPAVRQMIIPRSSLQYDMEMAIKDPSFFRDGDVQIRLRESLGKDNTVSVQVHSAILRKRCHYFETIFGGYSGGIWLAERRDQDLGSENLLTIDLLDFTKDAFNFVLRFIYADTGEELFDEIVSEDLSDLSALEELIETVFEVMELADYLMIERLVKICQKVIGRYVNVRNVTQLLHQISPFPEKSFQNAALKYICLCLEPILQNRYLDDLEDDMLSELDKTVRQAQRAGKLYACLNEENLRERHPELGGLIQEEKQDRITAMSLAINRARIEERLSSSQHANSFEDSSPLPPRQKTPRKSSYAAGMTSSLVLGPSTRGKAPTADLVFEMSDGEEESKPSMRTARASSDRLDRLDRAGAPEPQSSPLLLAQQTPNRHRLQEPSSLNLSPLGQISTPANLSSRAATPRSTERPWGTSPLPTQKLAMKEIMAQTSSAGPSNLSLGLSAQAATSAKKERIQGSSTPKLSQKERKRLLQAQQIAAEETNGPVHRPALSPWQAVGAKTNKGSSTTAVSTTAISTANIGHAPPEISANRPLTMRQTIAGKSPVTSAQNTPGFNSKQTSSAADSPSANPSGSTITPRSIRHTPLPVQAASSPSGLSLQQILSQQQAEKDFVKDAMAKRSLQDIQAEQEFQEWWDAESKRHIAAEEARKAEERKAARLASRSGGEKGGKKTGGKRVPKGKKEAPATSHEEASAGPKTETAKSRGASAKQPEAPEQAGGASQERRVSQRNSQPQGSPGQRTDERATRGNGNSDRHGGKGQGDRCERGRGGRGDRRGGRDGKNKERSEGAGPPPVSSPKLNSEAGRTKMNPAAASFLPT